MNILSDKLLTEVGIFSQLCCMRISCNVKVQQIYTEANEQMMIRSDKRGQEYNA